MKYIYINAGIDTDSNLIKVSGRRDSMEKIIEYLSSYVTYNTSVNDLVSRVKTDPSMLDLPDSYNTFIISLLLEGIEVQYFDLVDLPEIEDNYEIGSNLLLIKDVHDNVSFIVNADSPDSVELTEYIKNLGHSVNIFTNKIGAFDPTSYNQYFESIADSPDPVKFLMNSPIFNKILELNNYRLCYIHY